MLKTLYALAGALLAAAVCLGAAPAANASAPPAESKSDSAPAAGAEHGSGHEGGEADPLKAPPELAVWTLVVFLVVLAVLWRFAWGPISQGLARREQRVADQIAQAEQANQSARELLAQYERKLAEAQSEVRAIVEQGRRDAEAAGRKLVEAARGDAQQERQRALHEIDLATAGALKELAERSAALAVELAGRIVQQQLDARSHARLIEQAMRDFTAAAEPSRS